MIEISNNLYLNSSVVDAGNPIIGYQSVLSATTISADYESTTRPTLNLANESTAFFWESTSAAEQFIYFTNAAGAQIDYIGIARHNFGSGGVQYQLQYENPADTWNDVFSLRLPADDASIIHHFDALGFTSFRLRLIPSAQFPRIAHIKLGKLLALQRGIYVGHSPVTLNREPEVINNVSEKGQFLGSVQVREFLSTSVSTDKITPDWYRTYITPFRLHARTGAFFWAWKPIKYPLEVGYGWIPGGKFNVTNESPQGGGFVQFSFNMKAIA